jgi:hypothetical protein
MCVFQKSLHVSGGGGLIEAKPKSAPTDVARIFMRPVIQATRIPTHGGSRGGRIYGIGPPSRARTLINYVGLDGGIFDCVLEINGSYKIGK